MARKVLYGDNLIFCYDNILDVRDLRFRNSILTISGMPSNFRFVEDPNPPTTILAEEEPESTSLVL